MLVRRHSGRNVPFGGSHQGQQLPRQTGLEAPLRRREPRRTQQWRIHQRSKFKVVCFLKLSLKNSVQTLPPIEPKHLIQTLFERSFFIHQIHENSASPSKRASGSDPNTLFRIKNKALLPRWLPLFYMYEIAFFDSNTLKFLFLDMTNHRN